MILWNIPKCIPVRFSRSLANQAWIALFRSIINAICQSVSIDFIIPNTGVADITPQVEGYGKHSPTEESDLFLLIIGSFTLLAGVDPGLDLEAGKKGFEAHWQVEYSTPSILNFDV